MVIVVTIVTEVEMLVADIAVLAVVVDVVVAVFVILDDVIKL